MPLRTFVFGLVLLTVLSACEKQKNTFNNTDCDTSVQTIDSAQVGLLRYWVNVEIDPITDDQVKVYVRSNGEVNIDDMDALYIQLKNRYGCYQTKNREKHYAIDDDYFVFREIPPTFVVAETTTKVSMQLNDSIVVVLEGDTL